MARSFSTPRTISYRDHRGGKRLRPAESRGRKSILPLSWWTLPWSGPSRRGTCKGVRLPGGCFGRLAPCYRHGAGNTPCPTFRYPFFAPIESFPHGFSEELWIDLERILVADKCRREANGASSVNFRAAARCELHSVPMGWLSNTFTRLTAEQSIPQTDATLELLRDLHSQPADAFKCGWDYLQLFRAYLHGEAPFSVADVKKADTALEARRLRGYFRASHRPHLAYRQAAPGGTCMVSPLSGRHHD